MSMPDPSPVAETMSALRSFLRASRTRQENGA
jgi:hypothetical protein